MYKKLFGHRSIESFRRKLSRNSQLRIVCGLNDGEIYEKKKLLSAICSSIYRIFKQLKEHKNEINKVNERLIKFMYENPEEF